MIHWGTSLVLTLGRTFPSVNDPNLAEDPGFGLSVPYDAAANGTAEVFDNDGDGFGDSYFLNQDSVSGDMEDANLLVAAASNVVSTRSDTFTVHFRVRSFKQNPQTLVYATDPEFIVGESRYVMIVDRPMWIDPATNPAFSCLPQSGTNPMSYGTLVIVATVKAAWNLENRFTGWG